MNELSSQSRALLAEARRAEHIGAEQKSRVQRSVAERIAAGLAVGSALTATATAAEAAHMGTWATVLAWVPAAAKVVGVVAVTGAVSVGVLKATRVASRGVAAPAKAVASAGFVHAPAIASMVPTVVAPTLEPLSSVQVEESQAVPVPTSVRLKRSPIGVAPAPEQPSSPGESTVSNSRTDALSRQVTAIREARVAIRNGNPQSALAALDRELPEGGAGALAPEATLARVAAYCRLGDIESARRVASRFMAQYPQSPLRARMRESCGGSLNDQGATNF